MTKTYRPDVATPRDIAQAAEHFTSGVNDPGEARGLAMSGRHFGITCSDIRTGLVDELELYTHCLQRLFVDSGAFSEVDFPKNAAPVAARPIQHETWIARLELAARLADTFGPRCYVVAPDRVGCQATTLERLARYAPHVAAIAARRAQIIVPVQKGALPMSEMFRQACEILGLRQLPIAGVPMKKDATSLDDLAELVRSLPWFGARIHLLGLGPKAKNGYFAKVVRVIKSIRPNVAITSDATQAIRGEVGRTNARHGVRGDDAPGGRRRLTVAQDRAHAMGLRGSEKKAAGIAMVGGIERDLELEAANAAGWFDVELFDNVEEAIAHHAACLAERAERESDTQKTEAA